MPDALITAIDGADTNSNMVDDDDITDSDWEYFCLIRTGRSGEVIDGRKTRKSKTKLCQEIFGITSDGGNSMKRAMEEYDRIRDSFVVPWIRELLVAQTPKWEIIEEIWSVSRANQPNKVLEDLQRLIEFLQKYEGTPFVASQFRLLSELREECGEDYIRRWYEVERCFMLEDIAPEDIQAIAIRAYLDQVNWEFVTGYIVTALGQITQIQEAA